SWDAWSATVTSTRSDSAATWAANSRAEHSSPGTSTRLGGGTGGWLLERWRQANHLWPIASNRTNGFRFTVTQAADPFDNRCAMPILPGNSATSSRRLRPEVPQDAQRTAAAPGQAPRRRITARSAMNFSDLGLSPKVLAAVQAAGYET